MTPTIAPPTSPWKPLTRQLSCSSLMYTCCLIAAEASSPPEPPGAAIPSLFPCYASPPPDY